MNNYGKIPLGLFAIMSLALLPSSLSFANEQQTKTEIIPLDSTIGLEKTTILMNVPEDNTLPWGFVEGKINNPVKGYPVIIQIYDNDDQVLGNSVGAVLFAQTDVDEGGNYQFKFRVLNIDDGNTNFIFKGDYTVKIFKVVYLNNNLNLV